MKRKHKLYSRPKKAFEKTRILEENKIVDQYGLKNKREIWKTIAKVNYLRRRAKELARSPIEQQEAFFKKLQNLGLKVHSIADILALGVKDLLERRLQTLVFKKKIANTMKHSRQMITHKKILIGDATNDIPSTLITVTQEKQISLKKKKIKSKPVEVSAEEVKEESTENKEELS